MVTVITQTLIDRYDPALSHPTKPVGHALSDSEASRLRKLGRVVEKDGIHFGCETFIAPDLTRIGGKVVEVRYMPHDLRQIVIHKRKPQRPVLQLPVHVDDNIVERRRGVRDRRIVGRPSEHASMLGIHPARMVRGWRSQRHTPSPMRTSP